MASHQINLLILACTIFCLYWTISPAEAQSSHCGYHALNHYALTIYNTTHYTRYYYVYQGECTSSGSLSYELPVYVNGQRLYFFITYYRIGKREVSSLQGQLGTAPVGTVERETDLLKNDNTKRAENGVKNVQEADYAAILKDLNAKRSTRAFVNADYGKVLKNALRSERETKQEE